EPVLSYRIVLPEGTDPRLMMPKLRQLEEEEPELNIIWDEKLQEIQARIMGEVQLEVLQSIIKNRFEADITFDSGRIVYKETISNTVEGVGHFEPLKHYSEVHLLLEPGEMGSGLQFASNCSEEILGKSWQRLVLAHLAEKPHKGVLTGSDITDIQITLVSGRAHNKHTEGGDFREATYRAVRQGLKEAESVLLEPYYSFQLELPEKMLGRAMTDIEKMHGASEIKSSDGESAILVGNAPVSTMRNYQQEVIAYTKGHGRLFVSFMGYGQCHNANEVIESIGYDSERDVENPTGSVFCESGSGYFVEWNEVKNHMHVESYLKTTNSDSGEEAFENYRSEESYIGIDEIDQIINQTFYANQGKKSVWKRRRSSRDSYSEPVRYVGRANDTREEYLLVDGYNVIFAWPELAELAKEDMDGARVRLLECLSNYQGIKKAKIIVVFDAYMVEGHREEIIDYYNIHMVFTKEAQTADQYIEKFAHDNQKKYNMTVATSDGLQQIIIRGAGCRLLSARELKVEVENAVEKMRQLYNEIKVKDRNYLSDSISDEAREKMENLLKN
ncbi:MAG: NYN domain-containing protein, partial [Proteocatella sp.]